MGVFIAIGYVSELAHSKNSIKEVQRSTELLNCEVLENIRDHVTNVERATYSVAEILESADAEDLISTGKHEIERILKIEPVVRGGGIWLERYALSPDKSHAMTYLTIDSTGIIHNMQLKGSDYDYFKKEWYAAAIETGKGKWSIPYFDEGAGESEMTTFSVPFTTTGGISGVVTSDIFLNELLNDFDNLRPYPESVISRTYIDANTRLEAGYATAVKNDTLYCYASMPRLGLKVTTSTPMKAVTASLHIENDYTAAILFIALILLIVLSQVVLSRLNEPLSRLAEAARHIGDGDFLHPLPPMPEKGELTNLYNAMGSMQQSLDRYVKDLTESTRANERLSSELAIAHEIQMGLLPAHDHNLDSLPVDIASTLMPAKMVGGDFYDYAVVDDKIYFIVADVSGKGVPASLMSSMCQGVFRMALSGTSDPGKIAAAINQRICESNPRNLFMTMLVGCLEYATGHIMLCNAGHCPPLVRTGASVRYVKLNPNLPAGVMYDTEYITEKFTLSPGSVLVLNTDGVTEANNSAGEFYGEERLKEAIADNITDYDARKITDTVISSVAQFTGDADQFDDITLLVIKNARTLPANLASVAIIRSIIERVANEYEISGDIQFNMQLSAEEIAVNIINYSTAGAKDTTFEFYTYINKEEGSMIMIFTDGGIPFNPLVDSPEPDLDAPVETRRVGGLGIFMAKNLSNEMFYSRDNGKNILTLTFKI